MASMNSNLYQAGDYVYVETSSTTPYQIRRIADFKLGADGNVEAKVTWLYRRSTLPPSVIALADKLYSSDDTEEVVSREGRLRRHLARQRELFPSRQTETVPVTRIRGRCSVSLLSGAELPHHYLDTENSFFYLLLYDPSQRTLVADRDDIRVGPQYQVALPAAVTPLRPGQPDPERPLPLETPLWTPQRLSDGQVDTFLRLASSVGTLARAVDPGVGRCEPSLHLSAAAACRDATRQHALDALHAADYRLESALSSLVMGRRADRLALCRDQLDGWTPREAQLFEQALSKCGKAFGDIRRDFLPWKSAAQLVEYYYLWKTADRYLRRRRTKAASTAGRLTRLLLPEWDWAERLQLQTAGGGQQSRGPACAGCSAWRSSGWYAWGWHRLCGPCWLHWRRYGGLRRPAATDTAVSAAELLPARPPVVAARAGSSRRFPAPPERSRAAAAGFLLRPPPLLLLARRLCAARLRLRRLARSPLRPVSAAATQAECLQLLSELSESELERRLAAGGGGGGSVTSACRRRRRLDQLLSERTGRPTPPSPPAWLPQKDRSEETPLLQQQQPNRVAFPRPPTAQDGSVIYTPVRSRVSLLPPSVTVIRNRSLEEAGRLPETAVLRVRRPSISQTPLRRTSAGTAL